MNNEVKKLIENVDGWLTDSEAETLYNLAKECKGNGVIVEIGSWKGKSTICLAKGSKDGKSVKIIAIDPHTGSAEHQSDKNKVWTFEEFKSNISKAGMEDIITPIVKTSAEAAKEVSQAVEFVFIDGAHDYNSVKEDFELWFPKVIDGGIIALHDSTLWEGPKQVVKEYMVHSKNIKDIRFADSITYGRKVKSNTLFDRLKNRYRRAKYFTSIRLWSWAERNKIPKPIRRLGRFFFS